MGTNTKFTHAILNPPYKKIVTNSSARTFTRTIGFESVNLYSSFVGAALSLLQDGGELVAIIPRSFCNGPYYRDFRKYILANASLEHFHVFGSRDSAFSKDAVLQENVILKLRKTAQQKHVVISSSTNELMADFDVSQFDYVQIVHPNDKDCFIHLGLDNGSAPVGTKFCRSLVELNINCSTGPLVDFRAKEALMPSFAENCAPLLYPAHFSNAKLNWPKREFKKANAILLNSETIKSAWPKGYYVAIRRFSSKEEKRRIFASVVEPHLLPGDFVVFENHLNVLHFNKKPLLKELAWGLCAYLNSMQVDKVIRSFSGHTQVNATDLRKLKFPSLPELMKLGEWYADATHCTQTDLDSSVEGVAS